MAEPSSGQLFNKISFVLREKVYMFLLVELQWRVFVFVLPVGFTMLLFHTSTSLYNTSCHVCNPCQQLPFKG